MEIVDLEKRIEKIEDRNRKVELDKAWETSLTRKIIVAVLTYIVIGLFMNSISISRPWINAVVPTLGFLLSTLTIAALKSYWIDKFRK
jgi:F0F1-type ATP synthase assembly protein I